MLKSREKQGEKDPFLCTCGPCKNFWRKNFHGPSHLLYRPPVSRAADTSVIFDATQKREDHPAVLKLGDRVIAQGKYKGTVKFVGILNEGTIAPGTYVGLHLDDNIGSPHNGVYNGKRYFHCPRGHGAMVKYSDVIRCTPAAKRPPVKGNYMYPSYEDVKNRRKTRLQEQGSDILGLLHSNTDVLPEFQDQQIHRVKGPRTTVFDKHDIAVKDAVRREQEERRRILQAIATQQKQEEVAVQASIQHWQERFGNNKQGERMANTLRKLHSAYARGLALKRKQEREDDSDENDTESSDPTSESTWECGTMFVNH